MPAQYRVGVDIGGTFTDLILVDDATGELTVGKVLTTPSDPSQAVADVLADALQRTQIAAEDVRHVIHGTTLVTNAIIERKGARTALLTTTGFRDAYEIAREHRYDLYDLFLEMPAPLVPRHLRLTVDERVYADGTVARAPDERAVARGWAEVHIGGELFLMLSSGGISPVETASRFPLRLLESGPAGGALASAYYG